MIKNVMPETIGTCFPTALEARCPVSVDWTGG
jgi:hypothetical protein